MQKLLAIAAIYLAALISTHAHSQAPIIATVKPLHSLVAAIAGTTGEVELLVQGKASPHGYQLKPSQVGALQEAAILFYIDPSLELFLAPALGSLPDDVRVVKLIENEQLQLWPLRLEGVWAAGHEGHDHGEHGHDDHGDEHGHDEHDDHDDAKHGHDEHDDHGDEHGHDEHDDHDDAKHGHDEHDDHGDEHGHDEHDDHDDAKHGHDEHDAHGDEHGHDEHGHGAQIDPHIWLSPSNAKVLASAIAEHLSAAFPANSAIYSANLASLHQRLDSLDAELRQKFSAVSGSKYLVFHDAYQYLERDYQLAAMGAISIDPEQVSSPLRLREARANLQSNQISCVFSEPQFPDRAVRTVIAGTDTRIGVLDPLGADLEPGAELYPELLNNLADSMVACLK